MEKNYEIVSKKQTFFFSLYWNSQKEIGEKI